MKKSIKSILAVTLSLLAIVFSLVKLVLHFQPHIAVDNSQKTYNIIKPFQEVTRDSDAEYLPDPNSKKKEGELPSEVNDDNIKIEKNHQEKRAVSTLKPRVLGKKVPEVAKESENQTIKEERKVPPSSESEIEMPRPHLSQEIISDSENLIKNMEGEILQKKENVENAKENHDKNVKKKRKKQMNQDIDDMLEEADEELNKNLDE